MRRGLQLASSFPGARTAETDNSKNQLRVLGWARLVLIAGFCGAVAGTLIGSCWVMWVTGPGSGDRSREITHRALGTLTLIIDSQNNPFPGVISSPLALEARASRLQL